VTRLVHVNRPTRELQAVLMKAKAAVSYTHLTLPTTPYE